MHESSNRDGEAWAILIEASAAYGGEEEHAENCDQSATSDVQSRKR
jgi:hypothetical protein